MRLFIPYILVGALFATWFDAMDARYGVGPGALPRGFLSAVLIGSSWPISLPAMLVAVVYDGGGRWTLSGEKCDAV